MLKYMREIMTQALDCTDERNNHWVEWSWGSKHILARSLVNILYISFLSAAKSRWEIKLK